MMIFILFTLKAICRSTTRIDYKPTFETTFVYNNKDIRHTDQGFEAYHRFHSGRQTMYHQLDDDFCIVHFRKDLQVHNKNRL